MRSSMFTLYKITTIEFPFQSSYRSAWGSSQSSWWLHLSWLYALVKQVNSWPPIASPQSPFSLSDVKSFYTAVILEHPQTQYVLVGNTATFHCKTLGQDAFWSINERTISETHLDIKREYESLGFTPLMEHWQPYVCFSRLSCTYWWWPILNLNLLCMWEK